MQLRPNWIQPSMALCDCGAPLSEETCRICGIRLCGRGAGHARVAYGVVCGRTPQYWHVKGTQGKGANACGRHTDQEVDAAGLGYWPYPDDDF